MQKEKKVRSIGFGYIIFALFFLFNPNISVFDIFPDFIGYFLLVAGFSRLSDIMPRFEDVKERFLRLAWISVAKFLSIIIIFVLPYNEQGVFGLVLAASFMVIDLIFVIPAWSGFFESFIYLATRYDGEAVFYIKKNGHKTETEKLKSFTLIFFVLKEIFIILPEFTTLSSYEHPLYINDTFIDIHVFRPHFIILFTLIAIVIGFVWLFRMLSFMFRIKRDKPFVSKLTELYRTEVLTDRDLFTKRRIKIAMLVLCFAFWAGIDFYIYDVNFIPDILSAALFFIGFALLYKHVKISLLPMIVGAFYGLVSLGQFYHTVYFAENFDITEILRAYEVVLAYDKVIWGSVIESSVFGVFMICVFIALRSLIQNHTGYIAEQKSEYMDHYDKEEKKSLVLLMLRGILLALASAITNVIYFIFTPYVEWVWMVTFAVAALCAFVWWLYLDDVYKQIEDRYTK